MEFIPKRYVLWIETPSVLNKLYEIIVDNKQVQMLLIFYL